MNIQKTQQNWKDYYERLKQLTSLWCKELPSYSDHFGEVPSSSLLSFMCVIAKSLTMAGCPRVDALDRRSFRDMLWPILEARGLSKDELTQVAAYARNWRWLGMDHIDPTTEDWTGFATPAEKMLAEIIQNDASAAHDAEKWLNDEGVIYSDARLGNEIIKDDAQIHSSMVIHAERRLPHNLKILDAIEEVINSLVAAKKPALKY